MRLPRSSASPSSLRGRISKRPTLHPHSDLGNRQCPSRLPAKIQDWPRDPAPGYRADHATPPSGRTDCKKDGAMSKKRKEVGSLNVFKDLGLPNAEEHSIKAQLVFKIETLMKERDLKQI